MEIIFTDGSSINNHNKYTRRGGYGVFFGDNDNRNISKKLTGDKITNQVAELTACIEGIKVADKSKKICIYTDSMYIVNSITKWCKGWEKNNWKNSTGKIIENKELMITLYEMYKNYNIEFKHIRAHTIEPDKNSDKYFYWYGNMMADKLAVNGSNL
jgi:ribonuclease HI